MSKLWYQNGYRRMLVDMHIEDWDKEFLSKYDPEFMAEMYSRANLTSAMFYCQSHVGLCYWPTKSGKMHAGLKGRDIVGELHTALKSRGIVSVAYYSLIFNNWAFLEHPEWRIIPSSGPLEEGKYQSRYGLCCPNNPGYRDFIVTQIQELVGGYDFQAIFYDMTFWPNICVCEHCKARFNAEYGMDIPDKIDWLSKDWCTFQTARELWLTEFGRFVNDATRKVRPGIVVNHNFAATILGAGPAVSFDSAVNHEFLGADFYGDTTEQLMVFKLMMGLSKNHPVEFMTSRCINLRDHVRLRSCGQMELQAMAATLYSSAFLFIDAINLDGTVNPGIFDRIGEIFKETEPYEPYLGGNSVEDIAVYFSSESKMTFVDNGHPLSDGVKWTWPHQQAVLGICRLLQEAHLPFGIITRKDLPDLNKYKVVVLPNVLRMTSEEADMLRQYAAHGGKIYASRYTSLTETQGVRLNDFMLADVFGCRFEADDFGAVTYMKPVAKLASDALAPQDYLSEFDFTPSQNTGSTGMLRLSECADGDVLGTVTLPYGSPHDGSVFDHNWASIHSYPPWQDTSIPALVRHQYGSGMCVYSAGDIECVASEANDRLLLALLRDLAGNDFQWSAETHPCVWVSVMHQPENNRFLVGFLNFQERLPVIPIPRAEFSFKAPDGVNITGVRQIPNMECLQFNVGNDGMMKVELTNIEKLFMFVIDYT